MTRKPNFWKCIMGVTVLALLFVGTLAVTRAPRTSAAKSNATAAHLNASAVPVPSPTPWWDAVFEIEGNAVDSNGLATPPDDWNDLNPGNIATSTQTSITGTVAGAHAVIRTFISDPAISTDLIYTGGGSKDFNDIVDWGQVMKGTGPPKDDIQHGYAAKYINGTHSILVFGADRGTNNGDANLGFWFFQNPVAPNNSGGFSGTHKNGDVFVLSAFSGGGGTSTIRVLVWVGTADPNNPGQTSADRCALFGNGTGIIDPKSDTTQFPLGSLCDITGASPFAGTGVTNAISIATSWQYKNTDSTQGNKAPLGTGIDCTTAPCNIPTPDFFEGAIDLTELGLATECFASFLLETRSSAEVSAVLKDFALGSFESCSGSCGKTVDLGEVCEGQSVTYTYETTNTGGTALGETLKDVNDNGTPCDAGGLPAGCAGDDTTQYIVSGLTEVPAVGVWTPSTCVFDSSPPVTPINVDPGKTLRCVATVVTPGVSASTTFTNTLTVHTVLPFAGAVVDCIKKATVKVNPNPDANNTSLALCDNPAKAGLQATFDLTLANSAVIGNQQGVSVKYYSDSTLLTEITPATAYEAANGTIVYAKVTNSTNCFSSSQVTLNVNANPTASSTSAALCDNPNKAGNQATFDLTSLNSAVGGGAGLTVSWFIDSTLQTAIVNQAAFETDSTTVYAKVSNSSTFCFSSAAVTLYVDPNPVVTICSLDTDKACTADGDLLLQATVTPGTGTITYQWKNGGVAIPNANSSTLLVTGPGTYSVDVTRKVNTTEGCPGTASLHVGLCANCTNPAP